MTCIVGLTDGQTCWLGGDSAGVSGTSLAIRADAKVFTSGPYAFGFTTSWRMGQLLRYSLVPPVPQGQDLHEFMCTGFADAVRDCLKSGGWAQEESRREQGGNFIVGTQGRLFEIFTDYSVAEREGAYTATGCGETFALGSLHTTEGWNLGPAERLRLALGAAEKFSTGVAGPFRIVSVTSGVTLTEAAA